jgi:hypothetical protein
VSGQRGCRWPSRCEWYVNSSTGYYIDLLNDGQVLEWDATADGAVVTEREIGDRVPYVLVDGRPAFKYRVNEAELRRKLRS